MRLGRRGWNEPAFHRAQKLPCIMGKAQDVDVLQEIIVLLLETYLEPTLKLLPVTFPKN